MIWKRAGCRKDEELAKKFRLFYPGTPAELETMVDEYRKKQIGIILFFLVTGMILLFFIRSGGTKTQDIRIWRNGYGEGQKEESLLLGDGQTLTFTVEEKEYTEEELEQAFQDSFEWIREHMLGENETAGEVRSDLSFMTEIPGGFQAEWISKRPEVLGHDGSVFNQDWLGEKQEFAEFSWTHDSIQHLLKGVRGCEA